MREPDHRALLDIACRIARDEPYEIELAEKVSQLFCTDAGTALVHYDLALGPSSWITVAGAAPLTDGQIDLCRQTAPRHPGWNPSRNGKIAPVVRLSDLVSLRRFWGTEPYEVFHGREQGRYPANAMLHAAPDQITFLALQRRTRDFSDIEMTDLTLVQHVLASAFRLKDALSRLSLTSHRDGTTRGGQHRFPKDQSSWPPNVRLTRRQSEVLNLAAAGWTNQRIARTLGITERTVRKHLSAAYDRTGTTGRVEAATWYQRHQEYGRQAGRRGITKPTVVLGCTQ